MRPLLLFTLLSTMIVGTIGSALGDEAKFLLYQTDSDRGGGTNQWWITISRLQQMPRWKLDKDEPPLPLGTALKSAKKWIVTQGVGGGDVESITLRPVTRNDSDPYRFSFYYIIRFGVAPYLNHMTCVVLMDGTILEPERIGLSTSERGPSKKK